MKGDGVMVALGQADVPQAIADIGGLRAMLWQVPNAGLRDQLKKSADQCEALLRDAMSLDQDAAPGLDCVTRLYEAFEEAKRAPAEQPKPQQQKNSSSAGDTGATILWIAAGGALLVGVVAAIS